MKARNETRRSWAQGLIADVGETDVTSHATTWPHAARLLADLMALSRDPAVPVAADIGDPPVRGAEHEDLEQFVEDQSVGHSRTMAAEAVPLRAGRQQGRELVPEGLDEA